MKHAAKRRCRQRSLSRTSVSFFLFAVLLFGVVAVFPWIMGGASVTDISPADVAQGKQRSLLLLIHDSDHELTAGVVIHTDTRTLSIRATGYPSQTEIPYGTGLSTLGQRYAEEGVAAGGYLSVLADEDYDATLQMSVSAVAAFVAECGAGIRYTLSEPVGILPAGEQTLSSLQVADVLRYDGWMQSLTGRAEAHAGIVAAIVNRYLTSGCDLTALFNCFTKLCEDTIRIEQFVAVREELAQLAAANDGTLCRHTVPVGRAVGQGADRRFVVGI